MLSLALTLAFALVAAAFVLSFLRLLQGPSAPDRVFPSGVSRTYPRSVIGCALIDHLNPCRRRERWEFFKLVVGVRRRRFTIVDLRQQCIGMSRHENAHHKQHGW